MKNLNDKGVIGVYIRTACDHRDHILAQLISVMDEIITSPASGSQMVALYIDSNQSGTDDRDAFNALVEDIEERNIGTLYMTDVSRISRDVDKLQVFLDLAKAKSVTIKLTN